MRAEKTIDYLRSSLCETIQRYPALTERMWVTFNL